MLGWTKIGRSGVAALVAGALALAGLDGAARAQTPVNIGFYPGIMIMTPIFVADEMGYYKAEGLAPSLISSPTGPAHISSLASGAIDVGFFSPSILAFAVQQGMSLAYFTGVGTMPWVLITRDSVKLPSKGSYPGVIRDLKGLNWGIYVRGSDSEMFMRLMAADAGLTPNQDVTLIGVGGPATGLPALKIDKIQVYLAPTPAPELATMGGFARIAVDMRRGEGPADFKGVVFMGGAANVKWLQGNARTVGAIIRAHQNAHCFIRNPKNLDRLVQILEKKMPVSGATPEQFRQMVVDNIPTFTTTFPEANFTVWNEAMLKSGMVKAPLAPAQVVWKDLPREDPKCAD
jgi:ABC-type nitrate/sulfonate/bicarbonate transport system substrate-binding protein